MLKSVTIKSVALVLAAATALVSGTSALASSRCPATTLPFSITLSAADSTAIPPTVSERDP